MVELDPNFAPVHFRLSEYYESKGMYDAWLKEFRARSGATSKTQQIYASSGYRGVQEAMAYWGDLRNIQKPRVRGWGSARAYSNLGRKSKPWPIWDWPINSTTSAYYSSMWTMLRTRYARIHDFKRWSEGSAFSNSHWFPTTGAPPFPGSRQMFAIRGNIILNRTSPRAIVRRR